MEYTKIKQNINTVDVYSNMVISYYYNKDIDASRLI